MQDHDWNDLKFLLALHRTGKLAEAGRSVGVSETTVARRIRTVERSLGAKLFVRAASGRYEATDTGLHIIDRSEAIEQANLRIREQVGQRAGRVTGVVRISSVPIIVNRILVLNLAALGQWYPDLVIELVPDPRNVDLSKREADLAIRFARPAFGGLRTRAQKLGGLEFGVYGPGSADPDEMQALSWIGYNDAQAGLPQARWLEAERARTQARRTPLRVSDAETALEAAACGLGKTILPRSVAGSDPRLKSVSTAGAAPLPVRDLWLLSHVDQSASASVAAAKVWLAALPWNDHGSDVQIAT